MNKKEYIEPVMTPVLLKHQSHLMQTSTYSLSETKTNLAEDEKIEIEEEDTYGKWSR